MKRAYYSNTIQKFKEDSNSSILGELSRNHTHALEELQRNAWIDQIIILKDQLKGITEGQVYFEFAIPRMGKRVDNIIIIKDVIFIVEFKVGDSYYSNHAIEQAIDYTLDLKNFHEGSHHAKLIPVVVSTNADQTNNIHSDIESYLTTAKTNKNNLGDFFKSVLNSSTGEPVSPVDWEKSIYKPTPTIVEAAQALYKGHNVKEISRSDSGAINLSKTTTCLNRIIENAKTKHRKTICFVTGVPGAGKTLAGLNIANERMKSDKDEHAVFLSGNGPLVEVLREALTRDEVLTAKEKGNSLTKKQAAIKSNAFIQNIHHFRDDNLITHKAPIEKVVVFDEAQRAWNQKKTSYFMKTKKGRDNFDMSEPEFLINVMDRHKDWCVIVCLIGGGQEINTGEAGLQAWIEALKESYQNWDIHYSELISQDSLYVKSDDLRIWLKTNGSSEIDLHLSVSVRSFRSEQLSNFVHELLEINKVKVQELYEKIKNDYPIVITRDLKVAKNWIRSMAKGSERTGIVASSEARRLKPHSIDVKNEISPSNWFLNNKCDIRSSYFLETIASEFDIQGLEIDWVCLAWGADFYINKFGWNYQKFKGTKWQNINQEVTKQYLKNAYRVLLTRARQGMVIFVPEGSKTDHTRPNKFYDETYNYLKEIGIPELTRKPYQNTPLIKSNASCFQEKVSSIKPNLSKRNTKNKQLNLFKKSKKDIIDTNSDKKLKIGKFVKTTLLEIIQYDLLSENEILNLQNLEYCKINFDIQYPLLKKALKTDDNKILRYWKGTVDIKGSKYYICSEWYENSNNNDRPYYESWLNKIRKNKPHN